MASFEDYMLPCLNKKLFGIECMGCGLQRSLALFFRGEFKEAFFTYPAIFVLIPLALTIVASFFYKFKYANKLINTLAIISLIIIIISYIVKITN